MDTSTEMPSSTTESTESQTIRSELANLDETAMAGLDTLAQVVHARVALATRTLKTLTTQYGSEDSRVKDFATSMEDAKATAARITVMRRQISTSKVQPGKDGWALQGHLLDAQQAPLARHTVFLVDANKHFLQQYGFSYTDADGLFQLDFAGPEDQNTSSMFLEVVDTQSNPVYLSTDAFTPTPGSVSYQEIVIGTGEPSLGDPPPEIRKVAMPPK
jgi:hypothetical protein